MTRHSVTALKCDVIHTLFSDSNMYSGAVGLTFSDNSSKPLWILGEKKTIDSDFLILSVKKYPTSGFEERSCWSKSISASTGYQVLGGFSSDFNEWAFTALFLHLLTILPKKINSFAVQFKFYLNINTVIFILVLFSSSWGRPQKVKKVKKHIAVCATSTAPLRELTCHMGSHCSVTCQPAEVIFPSLPQPIKAGTRFSDPIVMQGWVDKTWST